MTQANSSTAPQVGYWCYASNNSWIVDVNLRCVAQFDCTA